jgi:4-hydroxythreonine-4-phosphate dehydrogenase
MRERMNFERLGSETTVFSTIRPHLAIALGDPAGIGTEVVLKALGEPIAQQCDLTLVGSRALVMQTYDRLRQSSQVPLANPEQLNILDLPLESELAQQIMIGTGNAASGEASFRYLKTAIAHTLSGKFHGIITAPIAKSAWKAAGHLYPGQTELLAEQAGVERFGMMFVARSPHTNWTLRECCWQPLIFPCGRLLMP